ncbi:MAG: sigma-54-dependent Fis family transcriptional regulator [Deltaproteobacteria bacterium]|nr:sigma-54-dependent Fis family transcriptional regulator [Deltaproteobacteria bacterium]
MSIRILVVDDEETIRKLLTARFAREGWTVECTEDGRQGAEMAVSTDPNVIVTDIKMPGLDGFQFMDAVGAGGCECPIIVITGHGEKECAIEAMHKGAFDYLEKPFDMDQIALVVKRAAERDALRRANQALMKELEQANRKLEGQLEVKSELLERVVKDTQDDEILVGCSQHIQNLKEMIRTIAESFRGEHDPVVLVTGESGTGKEVVARYIHEATFGSNGGSGGGSGTEGSGKTAGKPFVAVNCAAFPEHLLESELFGYEKGAFTGAAARKLGLFELACGGTLFLDEIGEMDLKTQAKLLRVLQERMIRRIGGLSDIPVNPHIVAATNRDLARAVSERAFREDLYYRLNTIPLAIAPLRSRSEDIEPLARHFLKKLSIGRGKRFKGFSTSAVRALTAYSWPGNVRELKSVIERAVILERGTQIELSHLRQEHLQALREPAKTGGVSMSGGDFAGEGATVVNMPMASAQGTNSPASLAAGAVEKVGEFGLTALRKEMDENFVKQVLIEAMTLDQGNVSSVARKLKLDRANLLRMLKRFHIEAELFRQKKAG